MRNSFQIAIDGPVAAGCSTVARLVAEKLHFLYIDTGATYRMATLLAMRNGIDFEDEAALATLVSTSKMDLRHPTTSEQDGRLITSLLNGEDVSWDIRTTEISHHVPVVAKHPQVREILVQKQQQIAEGRNVVMEGRDITYHVLPDADLKIYMTANDEVRAKRRYLQDQSKGRDVSFEEVYQELVLRDQQDMERATDPLKKVPDAWEIDTSTLTIDQVVELIVARVEEMQKQE